ncbi:hypothetical protein [Roseibium polysiphoniae]|uniref:hypothetical protein n=1 Tax=Roseibium polysiphoniae TaxID=2571221 RepID=UPI00329A60BB
MARLLLQTVFFLIDGFKGGKVTEITTHHKEAGFIGSQFRVEFQLGSEIGKRQMHLNNRPLLFRLIDGQDEGKP